MKLENFNNDTSVIIGDMTDKKFGIIANDKMFSILSDKIYTDKIKAPIRELATNAYDAHLVANKASIPFEVHVPTANEPFFSIRDFGNGLDAKQIESLYTTYGWSDKSTSNKFVGCMGLGSKSPFAYTDAFELISIKDGVRYVYRCYMEQGIPRVMKFEEYNTEESSGLLVKFNVKSENLYEFRNKIYEVCRWFDVTPKFIGEHIDIDHDYKKVDNVIVDCPGTNYGGVVMGNVYYKGWDFLRNYIESKHIDNPQINHLINYSYRLILCADIGDFDIAVSRESLAMTEKNGEKAYNILTKWQSKQQKEFDDYVTSLKGNLAEQYQAALKKNQFYLDFGKWIAAKWTLNLVKGKTIYVRPEYNLHKYSRHLLQNSSFCFPQRYMDCQKSKAVLSSVCRKKYIGYVIDNKTDLFITSEKDVYDKLLEYGIEGINLDGYSQKTVITNSGIRLKTIYHNGQKLRLYDTNDSLQDVLKQRGAFFYIPFLYNEPQGKVNKAVNSGWISYCLRFFKHRIYAVANKDVEKIKKCKGCHNVVDLINSIFDGNRGIVKETIKKLPYDYCSSWQTFFTQVELDENLMPDEVKQVLHDFKEYQQNKIHIVMTTANSFIHGLLNYYNIHPDKEKLIEYVQKHYPLIEGALYYDGIKPNLIGEVRNYIKIKEEQMRKGNK